MRIVLRKLTSPSNWEKKVGGGASLKNFHVSCLKIYWWCSSASLSLIWSLFVCSWTRWRKKTYFGQAWQNRQCGRRTNAVKETAGCLLVFFPQRYFFYSYVCERGMAFNFAANHVQRCFRLCIGLNVICTSRTYSWNNIPFILAPFDFGITML